MGLLAKMKMRCKHMLGEVHCEVTQENVQSSVRPPAQDPGQNPQYRDCDHEAGTECQTGIDRPKTAPQVAHYCERPRHVAKRGGQSKREGPHAISRASASSVSRVLSEGS